MREPTRTTLQQQTNRLAGLKQAQERAPGRTIKEELSIYPLLSLGGKAGEEIDDWLFKIKMHFSGSTKSEERKVTIAAVRFTGYALTWWKTYLQNRNLLKNWSFTQLDIPNWDEFRKLVM